MAVRVEHDRSYDYDPPDIRVIWSKVHKAKRPYVCDSCNREIPIGNQYKSTGLYFDGDFKTQKFHYGICPRDAEDSKIQFEMEQELLLGKGYA